MKFAQTHNHLEDIQLDSMEYVCDLHTCIYSYILSSLPPPSSLTSAL